MELEVIGMEKVGNQFEIEVLNRNTRELVKVSPYQLLCGILLNDAPVANASATINSVIIRMNGTQREIRVNVPQQTKELIRNKYRAQQKNLKPKEKTKEQLKKEEIDKVVAEYRQREKERQERLKEITKNYARPGQLTLEEKRERRAKYFRERAQANKNK